MVLMVAWLKIDGWRKVESLRLGGGFMPRAKNL